MTQGETYTKFVPDHLVQAVGSEAALIAARLAAFCDENGVARVSFSKLEEIFGFNERTMRRLMPRLEILDIWRLKRGVGRGNSTEWIKGDNYDTFCNVKGDKMSAFEEDKRGQNDGIKGDKMSAYNKDTIKNAARRAHVRTLAGEVAAADGERAETGSPRQTEDGKEKPTKESKKMVAKQFDEFWRMFDPASEFENRKERCYSVFSLMSPQYRLAVLNELRSGAKHRANPLHYLQYYTPAEVKPEFPIFRNGMLELSAKMDDAKNGGRAIACVEAGEKLHIPDSHAFVYLDDARAHKLTIKWTIPESAINQ